MKRYFLALSLVLSMVAITNAQKNVLGFGCSAYGLVPRISYERAITQRLTFVMGIEKGKYFTGFSDGLWTYREDNNVKGWGIMPELRFYPFATYKQAPLGFFMGTHYRFRWLTERYFPNSNHFMAEAKAYNYGLNIGYKLNVDYLTFDFLVGIGKSGGTWKTVYEEYYEPGDFEGKDLSGLKNYSRIEVTIGFLIPNGYLNKIRKKKS